MNLTAGDIMSRSGLVTVRPGTTIEQLDHVLVENRISGAPVVSEDGKVVGVVSRSDILQFMYDELDDRDDFFVSGTSRDATPLEVRSLDADIRSMEVRNIMKVKIYAVSPDDDIPTVAAIMRKNHVHRVLVLEGGRLQGIISSFDLMGILENPVWRDYWEKTAAGISEPDVEFQRGVRINDE